MTASNPFDLDQLDPTMDSQQPLPGVDAPVNSATITTTNTTASASITPPPGPPNKAKSLSCGTCRERKVRCDKNQPCSTCQRAKVPCIFPSAKRLPRKRQGERKKTNEKLIQRLNRLEALVEKAGLDEKEGPTVEKEKKCNLQSPTQGSPKRFANGDFVRERRQRSETSLSSGSQPVGKSAVEGEMSRYLGSKFWANLSDEVSPAARIACIRLTEYLRSKGYGLTSMNPLTKRMNLKRTTTKVAIRRPKLPSPLCHRTISSSLSTSPRLTYVPCIPLLRRLRHCARYIY